MNKQIKLTKFEAEEIRYKIDVIIDSGSEMWESYKMTESELEDLRLKIQKGIVIILNEKEYILVKDEVKDLLTICECNYYSGFPEYKNDMIKLRKLYNKIDLALINP